MHHHFLSKMKKVSFFVVLLNLLFAFQLQAADRTVFGDLFGRDG
jgi:hypothetical protein